MHFKQLSNIVMYTLTLVGLHVPWCMQKHSYIIYTVVMGNYLYMLALLVNK